MKKRGGGTKRCALRVTPRRGCGEQRKRLYLAWREREMKFFKRDIAGTVGFLILVF